MENLIYSLNATIPIFLVIVIGYLLKQRDILNENFILVSNKLNFKVTLPILLFRDIANANILEVFDIGYILFCMIVTTICFFCIWIGAKIWIKDKSIIGAFVQASFRGSAAVLGIAFIQNIYKDIGMAPLMIIGTVPLYNIYSVIVLSFEANRGEKQKEDSCVLLRSIFVNIVTNPIIIGIIVGLIGSLYNFYTYCPFILLKTIDSLASIATPLALITIGAGFEGRKAIAKIKPTIIASIIKLLIMPAIFLPVAARFGFRDQKMIALLVMLGAPTTVSCYIMAKNMDNDGVLTSSIVVLTTLLSSVTITIWIYLLKSYHLIL